MAAAVCHLCNNRVFDFEEGYKLHCETNSKHKALAEKLAARLPAVAGPLTPATPIIGSQVATQNVMNPMVASSLVSTTSAFVSMTLANGTTSNTGSLPLAASADEHSRTIVTAAANSMGSKYPPETELRKATCLQCGEKYDNHDKLDAHRVLAHPMVFCPPCKRYVFLSELQKHFRASPNHWVCRTCDMDFGDSETLKRHIMTSHPELYCSICDITFDIPAQQDTHYSQTDAHPSCSVCKVGFFDNAHLSEHTSLEHPPPEPSFSCSACSMTFDTEVELKDHFRNGAPSHVTCPSCNEGFEDNMAFNAHYTAVHPMILCSTCRRYIQLDGLEEHFRTSSNHPTCSICDEGFENSIAFLEHALDEHPELSCGLCCLAFESLDSIDQHFLGSTLHPSCSDCSIGFRDADHLSVHITEAHSSRRDSRKGVVNERDGSLSSTSHPIFPAPHSSETQRSTMSSRNASPLSSPSVQEWELNSSSDGSVHDDHDDAPLGTPLDDLFAHSTPEGSPKFTNNTFPQVSLSGGSLSLTSDVPSSPPLLSELPLDRHTSSRLSARVVVSYWGASPSEDKKPPVHPTSESSGPTAAASRSPDSRWYCRVCLKDPDEPTATICGHIFCHSCIIDTLRKELRCPVCRKEMLVRLHV